MGKRDRTNRAGSGAAAAARLDNELVRRGMAVSRHRAQALIMAGKVQVDGRPVTKSGYKPVADAVIELILPDHPYVSRGGLKLRGALEAFDLDPAGFRALDVGASTGGFTHCLLLKGAESVTAADVGRGLLDWSLRNDPRVTVMENINARRLSPEDFDHGFDLVTMDVSFISILKILPALAPLLEPGGRIVSLVKPQFEAGRGQVGSGGVVREPAVHRRVLEETARGAAGLGFDVLGLARSPIHGAKGNVEFFILLGLGAGRIPPDLEERIQGVLAAVEAESGGMEAGIG